VNNPYRAHAVNRISIDSYTEASDLDFTRDSWYDIKGRIIAGSDSWLCSILKIQVMTILSFLLGKDDFAERSKIFLDQKSNFVKLSK